MYIYIYIYIYMYIYIYTQKLYVKSSYALAIVVEVNHSVDMANASHVEFKNLEKPWSQGRQYLQIILTRK